MGGDFDGGFGGRRLRVGSRKSGFELEKYAALLPSRSFPSSMQLQLDVAVVSPVGETSPG